MKLSDIELTKCEQPETEEFYLADDVFVKSGIFKNAGTVVPQHSHEYDHTTFIALGELHAWCDEEYLGHFKAPCAIFIKKHCQHTFMTTTANTTILCIHNISRSGIVDVHDLHDLKF